MENYERNFTKLYFRNRKGHTLSGCLHTAPSIGSPLIIMIHGFASDKDEQGLFVLAAEKFCQQGYSVFRYDCRGLGDNTDDFAETRLSDHIEDYQDALEFIRSYKEVSSDHVHVIGFSLGATIAVMGFNNLIKSMVLWSPALFPSKDMWPRYNREEIFQEISIKGYHDKDGKRVGRGMLYDIRDCNPIEYIQNIKCPTLIIHGSDDQRINVNSSVEGVKYINSKSEVKIIEGATHSFKPNMKYVPTVLDFTNDWFSSL